MTPVASLIETKRLSPVEITEAMLGRIDSLDSQYKSYATVMADQAMAYCERPSASRIRMLQLGVFQYERFFFIRWFGFLGRGTLA